MISHDHNIDVSDTIRIRLPGLGYLRVASLLLSAVILYFALYSFGVFSWMPGPGSIQIRNSLWYTKVIGFALLLALCIFPMLSGRPSVMFSRRGIVITNEIAQSFVRWSDVRRVLISTIPPATTTIWIHTSQKRYRLRSVCATTSVDWPVIAAFLNALELKDLEIKFIDESIGR